MNTLLPIEKSKPLTWVPRGWHRKQGYNLMTASQQLMGELHAIQGFKRKSFARTLNFSWIIERSSGWNGEISVFVKDTGEEYAFVEKKFRKYNLHLRELPNLTLSFQRKGLLFKEWLWVNEETGYPYLIFTQKSFFFSSYEVEILFSADELSQQIWELLLPLGMYLIAREKKGKG